MNIFVLDRNIAKCVQYYADKHVIKMILESAQLLSTAVRVSGVDSGYKTTHKNHPCSIWARESLDNWRWLRELVFELHNEYQFRYGKEKVHKSFLVVQNLLEPRIESIGLTEFAQAMPEQYKNVDVVTAYRNYYKFEKRHLFKWTNRKPPYWIKNVHRRRKT